MKKHDFLFITLGMLAAALAYTTTDIYVPALPIIQHYFSIPINLAQYTLSVYLFGLAIAQVIAGPIVDHVGYRKVFLPCVVAFMIVTIGCVISTNIIFLIVMRAFQALFAGVIGITARASFIRRFDAEKTVHIFTTISPFVILSGVIAPTLGGYIVYYTNWQCVFVFLVIYSIFLFLVGYSCFYVNEKKAYDTSLRLRHVLHNYALLLKSKLLVQCILINAIYLTVIFTYLTEAPFIYHLHGYTANNIGLTFVPIALAFLSASQLLRFLRSRLSMNQFVVLAYILIIVGLGIMAIPAFYTIGLWPMTVGITVAAFGMGFSNPIAFGKAMTLFPDRSGSASSLLTALPFIAGTLFTMIVHPICDNHVGRLSLFLFFITTICVTGYMLLNITARSYQK